MPADADNLRAQLGREPLRLATLAVRTWGLAGPNEREVTDRLGKRIDRELRLQFGGLEELTPDQLGQARESVRISWKCNVSLACSVCPTNMSSPCRVGRRINSARTRFGVMPWCAQLEAELRAGHTPQWLT